MPNTNKDIFDFLEKIYEVHISNQSDAVTSIETKALQLLGGIGIFLPLALALIANTSNTKLEFNEFMIAGCATSLLTICCAGVVLWVKPFKFRPKISTFYDDNKDLSSDNMRKEAILDMNKALSDNKKSLRFKGWSFNVMVILFILSVGLISSGLLVQKVKSDYNAPKEVKQTQPNDRRPKQQQPTKSASESATESKR